MRCGNRCRWIRREKEFEVELRRADWICGTKPPVGTKEQKKAYLQAEMTSSTSP